MKSIISRPVFFIGLIYIIGSTLYFGVNDKPTQMGLTLIAGGIIMAFGNLDKISRFRGAGFEAEMKQKIDEAYATLANLQDLAVATVGPIMSILAQARIGSGLLQEKIDKRNEIRKYLESLQIPGEKIKDLTDLFDAEVIRVFLVSFIDGISGPVGDQDLDEHTRKRLWELRGLSDIKAINNLDISEIRSLLGDRLQKHERMHDLKRLEFYIEHRQLLKD